MVGLASANSLTLDFDDLGFGAKGLFETQGFLFSSEGGFSLFVTGVTEGSETGVGIVEGNYTMELVSGEAFGLASWDLLGADGSDYDVLVTGNYESGGQITTSFTALADVFTTHDFSSSWQNLTSVVFASSGGGVVFDNIVATNAVPISAAVWLFASALAGVGWLRRKQSV